MKHGEDARRLERRSAGYVHEDDLNRPAVPIGPLSRRLQAEAAEVLGKVMRIVRVGERSDLNRGHRR